MVTRMIIAMTLICFGTHAQEEIYVRPGLITTGLTLTPSIMLNRKENNYYVSGFLQGRLDKRITFRGETFYYIDGNGENPYFKFNSRTFCGILYHLPKNNFDSHIGLMPGVSVMQVNDLGVTGDIPYQVVPSIAANIGFTYYVWKFFNFFANVTYVHSTAYNSVRSVGGQSDELMISAGLGLNINAVRAK